MLGHAVICFLIRVCLFWVFDKSDRLVQIHHEFLIPVWIFIRFLLQNVVWLLTLTCDDLRYSWSRYVCCVDVAPPETVVMRFVRLPVLMYMLIKKRNVCASDWYSGWRMDAGFVSYKKWRIPPWKATSRTTFVDTKVDVSHETWHSWKRHFQGSSKTHRDGRWGNVLKMCRQGRHDLLDREVRHVVELTTRIVPQIVANEGTVLQGEWDDDVLVVRRSLSHGPGRAWRHAGKNTSLGGSGRRVTKTTREEWETDKLLRTNAYLIWEIVREENVSLDLRRTDARCWVLKRNHGSCALLVERVS